MSTFRIERIDQGIPDEWIHRLNDDGAQIGNDIVAEDVNELSEGIQSTQEILLKTSRYLPDTLLDPVEGIASRLKYLESTAGQMTLQDAYENGNIISIISGRNLILGQRGEIVIDSLGNLSFDPETMRVKGAGASYLNITDNELTTYLSDMTIGATSADFSTYIYSGLDISFKDKFLSAPIKLSELGESSLATTSQTIIGAINELKNGTFNTTLQSVYDQSATPLILTSATKGPLRVENGTGNALLAALQVIGILTVSDQIETETLKVGSNFEITETKIISGLPYESSVEIIAPLLQSLGDLTLMDNRLSVTLSENGVNFLETQSTSLIGAINELKNSIDILGATVSKFQVEHDDLTGRHGIITTKSLLGTEASNRITVLNASDETVFSINGLGELFTKDLLLDTLDVKTILNNAETHRTGDGLDHSALADHLGASNPHDVVKSLSGINGDVVLQQGTGVSIDISGNSIIIAAEQILKSLQDIYDDSSSGNIQLALGKDMTWTNANGDWLLQLQQDKMAIYQQTTIGGLNPEIYGLNQLAITAQTALSLVANTGDIQILTQDNTKKVTIQGVDFSDSISPVIDPSLNQTVVGSINNLQNNNIRRFINTLGHDITKGEIITFMPLDSSLSNPIMCVPFFDFHSENINLSFLKQRASKNLWMAAEDIPQNSEGVFIRKGNLNIPHPNPTASGLEWAGSEIFLAPLSYFYIEVSDYLSINDLDTLTLGGKVFTARTDITNVDYNIGHFLVEGPNYQTAKNIMKAINYSAYTRDPNDFIGLYAVQDGVAATARITLVNNLVDGDFITFKDPSGVFDIVLTARTNSSLTDAYPRTKVNEFLIGATKEETTKNLAEAIDRTTEIFNLDANVLNDRYKKGHLLDVSDTDTYSAKGHGLKVEDIFGSTIKLSGTKISPDVEDWQINPSTGDIDALDPTQGVFRIKVFIEDRSNQSITCSTNSLGIQVTNALVQPYSDRTVINTGEKYQLLRTNVYYNDIPKIGEVLDYAGTLIDCYIDSE